MQYQEIGYLIFVINLTYLWIWVSLEAANCRATQELQSILWNPKGH
jgi:hypothetical protein